MSPPASAPAYRHALPLPAPLDAIRDADGATLVDLLASGLAERPMWRRFLTILAGALDAARAVLVIEGSGDFGDNTGVIATDPAEAGHVAASLDRAALHDLPEGEAQALGPQRIAVRVALPTGRSGWLLLDGVSLAGTSEARADAPAVLAALVPYLERIMPLYELVGNSERHRLVAEYVLETSGVGVVLVERDGRVVSANATAQAIIARSGLMHLHAERLRAHNAEANRELMEAINRMAALQEAQADPTRYASVALSGLSDAEAASTAERRLTLIVRPGPPYGPVSAPLRRTAVVILRDPARPTALPAQDLERLFGLSPAEARLATRLADGAGLDEAAEMLGISRNTARSQLQAIYAKTGVNRQGDLVRLLLTSAASHVQNTSGRPN